MTCRAYALNDCLRVSLLHKKITTPCEVSEFMPKLTHIFYLHHRRCRRQRSGVPWVPCQDNKLVAYISRRRATGEITADESQCKYLNTHHESEKKYCISECTWCLTTIRMGCPWCAFTAGAVTTNRMSLNILQRLLSFMQWNEPVVSSYSEGREASTQFLERERDEEFGMHLFPLTVGQVLIKAKDLHNHRLHRISTYWPPSSAS